MELEIMFRFALAMLWGGLVGIEREYRSKSAGFRTMIMISTGACAFTMFSQFIGGGENPDRIASNIVTGIGFLGAGVIFRGQHRINGITTAATIWAVAAVGMGIGAGYYFASGCASVLILLVLGLLPLVERYIDRVNRSVEYTIECEHYDGMVERYESIFRSNRLRTRLVHYAKEGSIASITWEAQGHEAMHKKFIAAINNQSEIRRFEF